jgi:deoxyadenosine/deoxycytidine kinase
MSNRPSIVTIEGCTGAGKTTLAHLLAGYFPDLLVLFEDLSDRPLFKAWLNGTGSALTAQLEFYLEFTKQILSNLEELAGRSVAVMDQSIAVHHFVYSATLAADHQLNQEEFAVLSGVYADINHYLDERFTQKSLVLHVGTEELLLRLKNRNRGLDDVVHLRFLDSCKVRLDALVQQQQNKFEINCRSLQSLNEVVSGQIAQIREFIHF